VKINQYCSVCKKHLDMEVIPTDDAGDDGVIWLRCPECQGFLPKFSGEGLARPRAPGAPDAAAVDTDTAADTDTGADAGEGADLAEDAAEDGEAATDAPAAAADLAAEPVAEYAARLAAADTSRARPYRATETYAVDDLIHHLAYGDIGIVVAKESLPGGRQVVRVYFEKTGIVQLIEQAAPDGR
jgi:hypothetical protein